MIRRIALPVVALAAVAGLAGCSSSISQADLEKQVKDQLTEQVGTAPDDVSCPDELETKVDAETRCVLTAGEDQVGVTVTVTSVDGDKYNLDIVVDDKVME